MNKFYLRTISYTLATIGFFIGFTSKVLAQYGAWVASYKYMGNVNSEICNEPLKGIKVTLENKNHIVLNETFTNESGNFNFSTASEDYDEKLFLKFTDVDGSKNNGEFLSHTETVLPTRNRKVDVSLAYSGQIPCLEAAVVEKDTVKNTISNTTSPLKVDLNIIEPPKQTPIIPDPIDNVLIYPNPNSGNFTILYTLFEKGNVTLTVYSSSGQLVYSENFISESGVQTRQLSIPDVAAGNYLLSISTLQKVISKNILIQP